MDDANSQQFINSIRNLETSSNNDSEKDIRSLRLKQILKIDNVPVVSTMSVGEIAPVLLSTATYLRTNSNSVSSVQFGANRSLSEWNFTGGASSEMGKNRNERSDLNRDNANPS